MTTQMDTSVHAPSYVFDQTWQKELERLRSVEATYDPASRRLVAALGLGPGWRCLEVGCGAGSMALWLADQVGPTGSVLATDLDPRFLANHGRTNLTVIRHDLTRDELESESFDLIHARAVLDYICDSKAAVQRLIDALRPGGWLVIEGVDFGGAAATMIGRYTVPRHEAALCERAYQAVAAAFASAGATATFGSQLPGLFMEVGLDDVGGEVHVPLVAGKAGQFVPLSMEHLRPHVVATGLMTEAETRDVLFLTDPNARYLPPFMVTVWGRRAS